MAANDPKYDHHKPSLDKSWPAKQAIIKSEPFNNLTEDEKKNIVRLAAAQAKGRGFGGRGFKASTDK